MARAKKNKPLPKSILVVVEGETERIYFERLKGFERYTTLRIKPDLPKHSNIKTLLDYAKKEQNSGVYDYIWLLFDRDILLTQNLPKSTFELINNPEKLQGQGINIADSMPCFEIWFLLHFCLPKQTYQNQDKLIEELCKYIPAYCKKQEWLNKNDIYAMLKDKIDIALKNSEALRGRNKNADSSDYSMCNVDLLIEKIQELGKN
ncbi:MAG: RloB domain-containing protein [Treponema sp.]|nr:RloB domain-containing protein [Treponema sp.]